MTSDGRWHYIWDAENRLIKVETRPDTPSGSCRRIEWTYDALGRRIQQVTSIWTNNAWFVVENLKFVSNRMLFGRHIVELNGTNNTLVRTYVWGLDLSGTMAGAGGVGGLAWVTLHATSGPASWTHFTCYDGNGNIVALVSATTGDVTARYEYGPFGELIRVTGPVAALNPFRFSTKRTDPTIDLVLYEYRGYQPNTGRWLSRDLLEDQFIRWGVEQMNQCFGRQSKRDVSPYLFVNNNPNLFIDPDGRLATCPPGGILGATWGIALAEPTPIGEVIATGVTIGVGVAVCVDAISHCLCKRRHPNWMKCRKDATNDPVKALARDAVPVPGWTGPLLAAVHPRGPAKNCPGGAPGARFGMEINYVRHTETDIVRWEMEIPVNCCACCNIFTGDVSCEVVHRGIGSGGQPLPPPVP
jgi:RHS repeat-associated protein